MKAISHKPSLLLTCLFSGCLAQAVPAASLMFDFGQTAVTAADATKSPGHASGAVPAGEITWNQITADKAALVYGDGSAAVGIAIDIGRSAAGVDTIDFNDNGFTSSALGGAANVGIYSGTSPVKDGFFGGSGNANNLSLGVRVDGLPAGNYSILVHGRNTSQGQSACPERFYAMTGPSATTFSFSLTNLNLVIANSFPANTTSFVAGDNYGKFVLKLTAGQSLFIASEGTTSVEWRGFLNTLQITPATEVDLAPRVTVQPPANSTVLAGMTAFTLAAQAQAIDDFVAQWLFNGNNIPGATNVSLVLSNLTTGNAGTYSLLVSNSHGFQLSADSLLNVTPILNTPQMTNIWNIYAGERTYMDPTNSSERGLAFYPATSNLLVVSRTPSESVIVLDSRTGAEKHVLDVTGAGTTVPGSSLGLNSIGVADDGVVYAASVIANTSSGGLSIYRWDNDLPTTVPFTVFSGDPGYPTIVNGRYGDYIAVRGSGANTQILLAPGSGTNVVLLRTITGDHFGNEVPPLIIPITGASSGFAQLGIAFGPETNTFWAKTGNSQLFLVQFDLEAATGAVVHAYPGTSMPGSVRGLAASADGKWLAGVSIQNPDSVRLYDISNLEKGPILNDEELYAIKNPNPTLGGTAASAFGGNLLFALDSNNGLKAFLIDTNFHATAPLITSHPASQSAVETAASISFSVQALGAEPLAYQWLFNGTNYPNATDRVLILSNITLQMAGTYSVMVSNAYGFLMSSNAMLAVSRSLNTAQMTNIWTLLPMDRAYLGTNGTERGIAYNPARTNLLLVSRNPSESIVVLDPETGTEKHFLDVSGIPGTVPGVSLGINQVGVTDSGAVLAGSVTVNSSSTFFYLYYWPDDSPNVPATTVFEGDPGGTVEPALRWGDAMAVRGSGPTTQVLLAPGTGTNVTLLRTTSGANFSSEVPPAVLAISDVPSGFAALGVAFGAGNTFWGKAANGALYLVEFDLTAATGTVARAYSSPASLLPVRGISTDSNHIFMAGVAIDTPDNVRLYDISNLVPGPVLRDQELFSVKLPNITAGGTASTAIGGGYVFALDTNNGLKVFRLNPDYIPPLGSLSISSFARFGTSIILTWPTENGPKYQVQTRSSMTTGQWVNVGIPITGTGEPVSTTNTPTGSPQFFRIEAQ